VAGGVFYEISEDYLARLKTMGFITRGNVDFKKFENNNPQYAQLLRKLHSSIYGEEYWKDLLIKISEMWMDPDEYPSESAARITVPTLIMHGDHDSIPLDNPIRLYQIIPKAELSIIPNATHTSIFSQSEIVAKIILEFLKRNK
jgi:pimeloyl-ACP methyl ester carboxylesterase